MIAGNPGSPEVSLVVPSFKSRETIGRTLESIFSQESGSTFEVIVVDSSQDLTAAWIQSSFPKVRVISSQIRLSPGAARNRGGSEAQGDYLAFLDADAAPAPNWLESLMARMTSSPDIRAVGGAVEIGNPESMSARILHWIEFSEFLTGTPSGFKAHLSSSNLLIAKGDFEGAGGFNESFLMAEDLLLSRSFAGGLFFENTTAVKHYYRSSWQQTVNHLRKLGFWSGRLRRAVDMRGSWLRTVPIASLGLPFVRTALVLKRVWLGNRRAGLSAFVHSPLILVALFHWSAGFYQGLRNSRHSDMCLPGS